MAVVAVYFRALRLLDGVLESQRVQPLPATMGPDDRERASGVVQQGLAH